MKGAGNRWPALELDAIGTLRGAINYKVWLWLVVERESRRIVAWAPGDRSRATAQRLWQQPPAYWRGPRYWYFTDLRPTCGKAASVFYPAGSTDAVPTHPRQRRYESRGGQQLRLAPAVWHVGAQIELVQ